MPRLHRRTTQQIQKNLTKEFLFREYITNKKSAEIISKETGNPEGTIRDYINRYKLRRKKLDKYHDLVGKKFGFLTVTKYCPYTKGQKQTKWYCKCKCGEEKVISATSLYTGGTKSCGCKRNELIAQRRTLPKYHNISGAYWKTIQNGAKARNIPFKISVEEVWKVWKKQDGIVFQ